MVLIRLNLTQKYNSLHLPSRYNLDLIRDYRLIKKLHATESQDDHPLFIRQIKYPKLIIKIITHGGSLQSTQG